MRRGLDPFRLGGDLVGIAAIEVQAAVSAAYREHGLGPDDWEVTLGDSRDGCEDSAALELAIEIAGEVVSLDLMADGESVITHPAGNDLDSDTEIGWHACAAIKSAREDKNAEDSHRAMELADEMRERLAYVRRGPS